jgi:hypothetical protein
MAIKNGCCERPLGIGAAGLAMFLMARVTALANALRTADQGMIGTAVSAVVSALLRCEGTPVEMPIRILVRSA